MKYQLFSSPVSKWFISCLRAGLALSLAVIPLAWSQSALADEQTPWAMVGGNLDSYLVYIDKSRILKKGNKLQVWTLFNYA